MVTTEEWKMRQTTETRKSAGEKTKLETLCSTQRFQHALVKKIALRRIHHASKLKSLIYINNW